jgi:hypothetical protein
MSRHCFDGQGHAEIMPSINWIIMKPLKEIMQSSEMLLKSR